MFTEYTVLFIGYSITDPIMTYLSRGLSLHQLTKRYAFTLKIKVQEDYWRSFGITEITYPKRRRPRAYSALPEALSRWVSLSCMGALDHDEQIKNIVNCAPPLEIEIQDYMKSVLNSPNLVQSFVRYANNIEWLAWTSEKPVFKALFKLSDAGEASRSISRWIVETYLVNSSDEIMAILQKNHMVVCSILWNDLAWYLSFRDVPIVIAHKWIGVLLTTFVPGCSRELLGDLLCKYKTALNYIPLQLFEFLTQLSLYLEPNFLAALQPKENYDKVSPKISMLGDNFHLNKAWQEGLKQNIGYLSETLELVLTSRIIAAHLMLKNFGVVTEFYDPMSRHRSGIEPHEQDRYPKEFDVVIDAARDTLEWLVMN